MARKYKRDDFRHIAGELRSLNHRHANNQNCILIDKIRMMLEKLPLHELTPGELDYLERVLSAGQAVIRREFMRRFGITQHEWIQPRRGHPWYVRQIGRYGLQQFPSCMDHPLIIKHQDGEVEYCGEPYHLEEQCLRDLVSLADQGWFIWVSPSKSTHFPGQTMLIRIHKKGRCIKKPNDSEEENKGESSTPRSLEID